MSLEQGNRFYQNFELEEALKQYNKAYVECTDEATVLRVLSNRAQVHLKLRQYDQCIKDTSAVLKLDALNRKSLMRRSIAYEYDNQYTKSYEDIEKLLEICPSAALLEMKRRIQSLINRDEAVMTREGVPDMMISDAQTLRLVFIEPPECLARVEREYRIRVCITNEFGLYHRRRLFSDNVRRNLCCVAYRIDGANGPALVSNIDCDPGLIGDDGRADLMYRFSSSGYYILHLTCDDLEKTVHMTTLYSLPIRVASSEEADCEENARISGLGASVSAQCIRSVKFKSLEVFALECPDYLGIGGKVWDSTYALLSFLERPDCASLIKDKRVLELGSGTGMAGIALAALGPASVTLTDLPTVVSLIQENLRLNCVLFAEKHLKNVIETNYCAQELVWEHDIDENFQADYDVIIASDIVYDPITFTPLYDTLCGLLKEKTFCIMAHRTRNSDVPKFFQMLHDNPNIVIMEIKLCDIISPSISSDISIFLLQNRLNSDQTLIDLHRFVMSGAFY